MPAIDSSPRPPAEDLSLLVDIAREAGEIAMRFFRRRPKAWLKRGKSPVSEADIAVDRFLRERLLGARPDHGWLSEETVDPAERVIGNRTFVVDPIDGTRAFLDGQRSWCISIAIVEDGRPIAGVLGCPAREEVYAAAVGAGARWNGGSIAVRVRSPEETVVVAGPKVMIEAMPEAQRARIERHGYVPSLACRIAMVARGALDATFVKPGSYDWDLAAADLILHEAGGGLVDHEARTPRYAGRSACHGALAAAGGTALLETMARAISGYTK